MLDQLVTIQREAINTHELMDSLQAFPMNQIRMGVNSKAASSRGHKQDVKQFVEISYAQIKCSIADLTFDLTVEY
jgi:hypothetical protein